MPVVVIIVGVALLALWAIARPSASGAAAGGAVTPQPEVTTDVSGSDVQTGERDEDFDTSVESVEGWNARALEGVATGASIGLAAGGGGLVGIGGALMGGALGGLIMSFINEILEEPLEDLDWLAWGMPYATGWVEWSGENGDDVTIPIVAEDGYTPSTIKIEGAARFFPDPGSFEAAKASGMFAWRPWDVSPVQAAIDLAPTADRAGGAYWLPTYRDAHLAWPLWVSNAGIEDGILDGADPEKNLRWVTEPIRGQWAWPVQPSPREVIHEVRRLCLWIAHERSQLAWNELRWWRQWLEVAYDRAAIGDNVSSAVLGVLTGGIAGAARGITGAMNDPNPWAPFQEKVSSLRKILEMLPHHISPAGRGFPGAWRYTRDPSTVTRVASPAEAERVTAEWGGAPLVRSVTGGGASSVAVASPLSHSLAVQRATSSAVVVGARAVRARTVAAVDDRRFECWLNRGGLTLSTGGGGSWGTREVVPLRVFVEGGAYSSMELAAAALEAGDLVIGPNCDPAALAVWRRLVFTGADRPMFAIQALVDSMLPATVLERDGAFAISG